MLCLQLPLVAGVRLGGEPVRTVLPVGLHLLGFADPQCFPGVPASVDMWRLSHFRMPKPDFEGFSEETRVGSSVLTRSCSVNHGVPAVQQPQWCGWNLEKAPGKCLGEGLGHPPTSPMFSVTQSWWEADLECQGWAG